MTINPLTPKPRRGKLKITQESVLRRIANYYELKGLDVAIEKFEQINELFSTEPGWDETAKVVTEYLIEKRKEENQRHMEEKLKEQRAAASSVLVLNKNDLTGIGTVSQANLVMGDDPEITFDKHN